MKLQGLRDKTDAIFLLLTFHIKIDRALGRSQFIGGLASIRARVLSIYGQHVQRRESKVAGGSIPVTGGQWFAIVEPLHLHVRVGIRLYATLIVCALTFD